MARATKTGGAFADEIGTKALLLFLSLPILWILGTSLPEVLRDRIYPFDSALIAANGALFQSLFAEFGQFLAAPVDWLWKYFEQYPAVSLRRHAPLFGFAEGVVFSVIGVSASAAKLTLMLFACVFAIGTFFVAHRIYASNILASCTAMLIVATPEIALHYRSVWLDIPSLAFAIWAFYFYLARLDGDRSLKTINLVVIFVVLALYTYQPTIFLFVGMLAFFLVQEWRRFYKDRTILIGIGVLTVLMLPLFVFTIYFAMDGLKATTGVIPEEWKEFSSPDYADWIVREKLSVAYWTFYAKTLAQSYPLQMAGVGIWIVLRIFRKPIPGEVLMFVCFIATYLCFSWLVVKGHRYGLYMVVPASFLTVGAIRDMFTLPSRRQSRIVLFGASITIVVAALIQYALVPAQSSYRYLSDVDLPVSRILADDPSANILYSGRSDAAFVFYVRSLDTERSARVHRASVQLEMPSQLAEFVGREDIEFIVLEEDNPGYDSLEIIDLFRISILHYVEQNQNFELWHDFRLPYGVSDIEGSVVINVYRRVR